MKHAALQRTRIDTKPKRFEPQISLLTDFGNDESVYAVKSAVRYVNNNVRMEDICHSVPIGNILVGAWRLKRSVTLKTEPEGTIYIAVVDPGVGTERRGIIIQTKTGKFLVGPDNGLLSLAGKEEGIERIVEIQNISLTLMKFASSMTFHGKDIFAPVAGHLSKGVKIDEFGPEIEANCINQIIIIKKESTDTLRSGPIVDIDAFGTIRTDIPNHVPERFIGKNLGFAISSTKMRLEAEARLVRTFGECFFGEQAFVLSSTGSIDLAVNMGSAAERFGFNYGDIGLSKYEPINRITINLN